MNPFKETFTLCHWKELQLHKHCECESGFESVKDVDKRTHELREKDKHIHTTFYPTYSMIPNWMQKLSITFKQTPRVTVQTKKE